MTKKQQQKLWIAGAVLGGAGLITTIIVLSSGGGKGKIGLNTPEKGKAPITPPSQTPVNNGAYTTPKTTWYSKTDTIAVQTYLYTHYPLTIKKIGDIGTYGKPDGEWGANTQKVADSVISRFQWEGVAQLVDYANRKQAPRFAEWIKNLLEWGGVNGLTGLELNL